MALQKEPLVAPAAVISDDTRTYVDWPAIFAGTTLATAISFVLLTFGSAIGLSLTSAYEGEGTSLAWFAIVAGLWLLWVQVSASVAGGYLTGRMRRRHGDATEYESDIRDGSHGLVTWALATLVAAAIVYSGAMGTAAVVAPAAATAGAAAGAAAGEDADALDPSALLVDRTLRAAPGAEPAAEGTRAEIGRILMSAATGDGGLDDADRQYLVATVAQRAGISEADAQARVDQAVARAREIEADVRAAAERARKIGVMAAFLTGASLLLGAAAAYFGGTLGGNHRDSQTVITGWYKSWGF
jgi:hypothetical protein